MLPLACSLDRNRLGDKGATALAAILNETKITHLRCAAIPVAFAFVSAPVDTAPVFAASRLGSNGIGGHHDDGEFISNTDGVMALCEGLKGSSVTSLECAAATPKCSPFCQRPLTLRLLSPVLAVCKTTTSAPREEPLSLTG